MAKTAYRNFTTGFGTPYSILHGVLENASAIHFEVYVLQSIAFLVAQQQPLRPESIALPIIEDGNQLDSSPQIQYIGTPQNHWTCDAAGPCLVTKSSVSICQHRRNDKLHANH